MKKRPYCPYARNRVGAFFQTPLPPPRIQPDSMEAPETLAARQPGRLVLLLHDHVLQALLVLALIVNFALVVYLVIRLPSLTDSLPMHFDANGLPDVIEPPMQFDANGFPDLIGARGGILKLPAIGFLALVLNAVIGVWAHRRERAASVLLASSALFVQVLMWVEAINIAGGPV